MEVTVDVPTDFAAELTALRPNEVSEILSLGISEWRSRRGPQFTGLSGLLERLAALPEPREVLELRPNPELASRAQELLEKSLSSHLTEPEEAEWKCIELAEHLVRIAKAQAALKLRQP